jgi:hypothetical protein
MKKKDYKKPVCLVVAIPHIAVTPPVSTTKKPPVSTTKTTGEALSREQRLWRYDDEEEY